jgi:hypothetical protein
MYLKTVSFHVIDIQPYNVPHQCDILHFYFILFYLKAKAAPLHAVEVLGGKDVIAPTHYSPRH